MVLVTGGTGFLGHHLLQELIKTDMPIRATHRNVFPEEISEELKQKIDWQYCDLLDVDNVLEIMQGVTQVYHCAAMVSFLPEDAEKMHHVNITTTENIVNACLEYKVQKLLHVSSVAAIARAQENKIINEKTPWLQTKTTTEYGISKYNSEMEVWRAYGEGLDVVVVNPGIILGEGKLNEGAMALFQNAYNEFAFYTKGVNAFVDVKDVVKAMVALMHSDIKNEKFLISAGNFSYKDIFTLMAKALHKKPPSKEAGALLSNLVWRYYAIKKKFTGNKPLITKETAHNAISIYEYDNSKLLQAIPNFAYTPMQESINRISTFFLEKINKLI